MTWTTLIRVSGLVAWYLLILEVVIGTMAAGGVASFAVSGQRKFKLHTLVSWCLLSLVAVHVGTIVGSHYKGWTMADVTGVTLGTYARNCGVAAGYLLIAVFILALLKRHVPRKVWTAIHHSVPFAILVLATIHGLGAGTDSNTLPIILPAVVALTLLGTVFLTRSYGSREKSVRNVRALKAKGQLADRRNGPYLWLLGFHQRRPKGLHYRKKAPK